MKATILAALTLAMPVAAAAQDGTFEVRLNGTEHTLEVSGLEAAILRETSGFNILSISGAAATGETITLILGPYSGVDLPDRARVEWRGDPAYAASADTGGRIAVSGAELGPDGALSFTFGGLVVPVEVVAGGALAPIAAGQGVDIDGSFSGTVVLP